MKKDSLQTEYITLGTGSKTLVVIPGLSLGSVLASKDSLRVAFDMFLEEYTLYIFAPKIYIRPDFSLEEMAEDIYQILCEDNIKSVYIYGVSMGGMVAQILASNHPSFVKKLALVSTLSKMNHCFFDCISLWDETLESKGVEAMARAFGERVYSNSAFVEVAAAIGRNAKPEEIENFKILLNALRAINFYEKLDKIACSSMVLLSKNDRVTSFEGGLDTAEKLSSELYIYDDYGHAVYDEAPDLRQRIYDFYKNNA